MADVVSESGDPVHKAGILKDMQRVSRGLAGHAMVRAQAGDRGDRLARCQVSRQDTLAQNRGNSDVGPRVCPVPVAAGCWHCLLIAGRCHSLRILD